MPSRFHIKYLEILLLILIGGIYIFIPSVVLNSYMNGSQTGKTIVFLWGLFPSILISILLFVLKPTQNFKITFLDALLFIWFVYIVIKGILIRQPISFSLMELIGLALFYAILRQIRSTNYIWLFIAVILGGTIQAVYGNLQLWGFYPSLHNRFNLTGSFFNPGPYAGYIAIIFPAALGFWLFDFRLFTKSNKIYNPWLKLPEMLQSKINIIICWLNNNSTKVHNFSLNKIVENLINNSICYLSFFALISIILVLPASQSRAAWLAAICSTVYLLILRYSVTIKIRFSNFSFIHKGLVFLLITIILFAGSIGAYFLKKDSADGRILIWKVTLNMIADYPFTGMGINGFKANYMNYQAEYFKSHPDSDEAMLAGDTNYSFNELLQQTAEHGAIGGLLIVFIFISAFMTNSIKKNKRNFESNHQNNRLKEMQFIAILKALLLSIFIFSMFSYPAQILPIKINLILALAYLSNNQKSLFSVHHLLSNKKLPVYGIYVGKGIVFCLIAVSVLYGIRLLKTQAKALKDWEFAFVLYNLGNYDSSIKEYALAKPVLRCNGDFLTNYGKALSMAGNHQKAIEVLQQATTYYPNTIVYTALGDSYKETGQIKKAELAYLQAWHMNPTRFYPKYLLAKLYDESGQQEKAVEVAKELMEKKIKVESTAIKEIKDEMKKIISKNIEQNKTAIQDKTNGENYKNETQIAFKHQYW